MSPKSTDLTVIVLAKNEEARIKECLQSVAWAHEIIVIDNGSTDDTKKIALSMGAKVIGDKKQDFAHLHTVGKEHATGPWLLYIDADEVVTLELQKEITEAISGQSSAINGYEIRRKNYYLGRPWPADEFILRLMRKASLVGWHGALHETARVEGSVGRLTALLMHYTHRTLEEMVAKTNIWSETEAKLRLEAHHPPVVWWRLVRVMITAFFDSFIRQGGWRAGTVGWIESMYQAFSMFITYAKLWEMQNQK